MNRIRSHFILTHFAKIICKVSKHVINNNTVFPNKKCDWDEKL